MLEVRLSQQRVLEDHWRRRRIPVVLSIGGGGDIGLWSSHRACPCHGSPTRSIRDLAASPRDSPPAALRTQKPGLRVARLLRRPPASSNAHTPSASPPRGLHTPPWPRTPRAAVRSPCPHHTSPTHLEGLGLCPCWCPADHRPPACPWGGPLLAQPGEARALLCVWRLHLPRRGRRPFRASPSALSPALEHHGTSLCSAVDDASHLTALIARLLGGLSLLIGPRPRTSSVKARR